jgi:2-polyprenyl-3-methyl-5-hydroxy-6-metoxy-1,4-benzoquinol methylase
MRCPICDTDNQWTNVDQYRLRKVDEKGNPINMCQCDGCGFVSYPSKYQSEDQIKEHYRSSYRTAPQATALFTGERKLQYHNFFLTPLFEEWKKAGLTNPVVGEIGSAYGMLLNWIRQQVPGAEVHGTELTTTYKRVAYHEYGLRLTDDFDMSRKYDLIISYHVLEHQLDPDKRLKEYASCLKDGGIFYLSAPIWFRELSNSGGAGFDIEWYWAPDHINGWAQEHLEEVIAKAGLEIIMRNTEVYGNTYILKKATTPYEKKTFDAAKYKKDIEKIFTAWKLHQENKSKEAIELWPNLPSAWTNHYEYRRSEFHKSRAETDKYLSAAIESCPNSSETLLFVADIMTRYERYDEAFDVLSRGLKKKPNSPPMLMGIANCYRMKALKEQDEKKKAELYAKSVNTLRFLLNVSSESLSQALTWIYADEANLPIPELVESDVPRSP